MADPRRGVYNPVLPLDVLILQLMPKEGTMFMGVYAEAAFVTDIKKAIAQGQLPSSLISTRLRVLHMFGYATKVYVPKSHTAGWQATPKGEQFVRDNPPPVAAEGGSDGG
jgi:hypothetical protein